MENYRIFISIFIFGTLTLQFSIAQNNANATTGGHDVTSTTDVQPTISACDGKQQNISEAEEQMVKYKTCIQPSEGKHTVYPFTCKDYKTMAKCFHEYIESVSSCYANEMPDWQKTDRMLIAATDYLCDPKNELLNSYFKSGARACIPDDEKAKCPPSVITILLNSTQYSNMSKAFLQFNYTKETCGDDDKNAKCFISLLELYCKERPRVSEIASQVQEIIGKESGCDAFNGGRPSLSPDGFALVLVLGVMTSFKYILSNL